MQMYKYGQIILTKKPRIYSGGRIVPSVDSDGKTQYHMQKNETGPLYYTIHKIQLKMDYYGLEHMT